MVIGPFFKVLLALAVLSALTALIQNRRVADTAEDLALWVQRRHPDRWDRLSLAQKGLPMAALMRLKLDGLDAEDNEFAFRYGEMEKMQRNARFTTVLGLATVAAMIATLAV